MSSTILYKFKSGTTFEALPLPGSAARLFEVKKAIVTAKKLDQGSMEFELSIRDATTNEEYVDETMLLPRGTRIVVQRLPAPRGQGFLARMARNQLGPATATTATNNFYTIESRGQEEEEEEYLTTDNNTDDKELAALRAATDAAHQQVVAGVRTNRTTRTANFATQQRQQRPNADPELREQEKLAQPKKRATGIPRTFLNLSAPPNTDAEHDAPLLQPNAMGFEELKQRGGGKSESASGMKRDLDYALKLTATSIPEYLQCAICNSVVQDAMILPWDPEGRTTCEHCIRDALTQNAFRCPLTGQEGVSPDDLLPNHALRKAAEQFVKTVMEKVEEIDKQQVDDDDYEDTTGTNGDAKDIYDADSGEKGVLVSKRTVLAQRKDEDTLGGEDDFGGDVFAVELPQKKEQSLNEEMHTTTTKTKTDNTESKKTITNLSVEPPKEETKETSVAETKESPEGRKLEVALKEKAPEKAVPSPASAPVSDRTQSEPRRERRRAPPAGYQMGPAGMGPVVDPTEVSSRARSGPPDVVQEGAFRGRDDRYRGGRGRGGGREHGRRDWSHSPRADPSPRDNGHSRGDVSIYKIMCKLCVWVVYFDRVL